MGATQGSGGSVQYAALNVSGDSASKLMPYDANIEIDYDANAIPTFKGGTCSLRYYEPKASGSDTADKTTIICTATVPSSIDGPANGASSVAGASKVQIEIYLDGNITPPVKVDLTSPSLASVVVELFGGHNVWEAESPPTHSGPVAALSFEISSATALEPASRSNALGWTDYILEGKGYARTTLGQSGGPGTATVSLELSASKLNSNDVTGATNGTCAELLSCCNAIVDTTAKGPCTNFARAYQNMVGAGLSQQQADSGCDEFLHLERGAALCP